MVEVIQVSQLLPQGTLHTKEDSLRSPPTVIKDTPAKPHHFLNLRTILYPPVSMISNLEDHHIYPKDYLRKNWGSVHQTLDSEIPIDCVINRTLIPKLTNVRVSNKPPSKYLNELATNNVRLNDALLSHLLSHELLTGDYDNAYDFFLDERAGFIMEAINRNILDLRKSLLRDVMPVLGANATVDHPAVEAALRIDL